MIGSTLRKCASATNWLSNITLKNLRNAWCETSTTRASGARRASVSNSVI
jgi:hypothetical protein